MGKKGSRTPVDSMLSFVPTAEDLERARQIMLSADARKKKSNANCLRQYVLANESTEAAAVILGAQGDAKQDYIKRYLAFQVAKTSGKLVTSNKHIHKDAAMKDVHR